MVQREMVEEIKGWIYEASEVIKAKLAMPLEVAEKENRSDLVTNVDQEIEAFFIKKIRDNYPNDQILGEEGLGDQVTDFKNRVWVIDPIDGTLNFIKQQENFCTMLAVYEDGVGQLGFIYEIMTDELLWGSKELGVYLNEKEIIEVPNKPLEEGLININTSIFLNNHFGMQELAMEALAVRMLGCAGIAFKEVVKGHHQAYVSYLQPWDYAPAKVIFECLGLSLQTLNGESLDLTKKVPIIGSTPIVAEKITVK
ncbi:inositol monophosphatase family protein [Vagococcus intermedius]|uniref:Inositol monophosphatase family protein n=1 Tax=Vagococcus intermedius TaxID=2991418 RepID=A0AAF0I5J3_9ENTE|nr:inositol monophosphatase family protein [Vagococcus intermedius]WEG73018.1 inositol monophosphatase family protein [Vagococcus intermedius]WEG75104.1 inositol monophosphatase family protein [Vagococcus intermedius]